MSWIVHSEISDHWMDLEIIVLSEVRQRKTHIIWYCVYVESKKKKKKIQLNLFTKQTSTDRENLWLTKVYGKGGMNKLGVWG